MATHFRWTCLRACGSASGTAVEDLSRTDCEDCRAIAWDAESMAEACGCRRPWIHVPVARAQHEIRQHKP